MTMPLYNDFFLLGIVAFTGDRSVDFSLDEDRPLFTEQQQNYLAKSLGNNFPEPVIIRQAHGDHIAVVDCDSPKVIDDTDAMVTDSPGIMLTIRTADCLPVFFCDEVDRCIGLAHCGWRGTQKGLAAKTAVKMNQTWVSEIKNIKAYFGPAIRSCCYEVGEEFKDYFPSELTEREGRFYLDLPDVNRKRLLELGIEPQHIGDCGVCTCCDQNYFSHRREKGQAGRMISLIYLDRK